MKSWEELLGYLNIEDDVPEMQGLVEAHKCVIIEQFVRRLEPYARRRNMGNDEGTDTSEMNTAQYIRNVVAEQGPSIRSENEIIVAGTVTVSAELPQDCPPEYLMQWEPVRQGGLGPLSGTIEASCKIEVTAIMTAEENNVFTGEMEMEFGGFAIMPIHWNSQ